MKMLPALDLFHAWSVKFTKDKAHLHPSPGEKTILAMIDHYNDLHFHDRNALRRDLDSRCPRRSTAIHEPEWTGQQGE